MAVKKEETEKIKKAISAETDKKASSSKIVKEDKDFKPFEWFQIISG